MGDMADDAFDRALAEELWEEEQNRGKETSLLDAYLEENLVWRTRQETLIRIQNLSDPHLLNIIKMLESNQSYSEILKIMRIEQYHRKRLREFIHRHEEESRGW